MARMTVAAAPGTGTVSLGTLVFGYQTFSAAGAVDGESFSYNLSDFNSSGVLTAWEVGTATYHAAGTTLTRSPLFSSNSNAAINASALAQVWITALATDFGGSSTDTVTNNITAAGTNQGNATVLTAQFNEVLTVSSGTGVILPTFMSTPGNKCRVASYGANPLLVYPLSGQTFFSGGVSNGLNEALEIQAGVVAEFECSASTTVYSIP